MIMRSYRRSNDFYAFDELNDGARNGLGYTFGEIERKAKKDDKKSKRFRNDHLLASGRFTGTDVIKMLRNGLVGGYATLNSVTDVTTITKYKDDTNMDGEANHLDDDLPSWGVNNHTFDVSVRTSRTETVTVTVDSSGITAITPPTTSGWPESVTLTGTWEGGSRTENLTATVDGTNNTITGFTLTNINRTTNDVGVPLPAWQAGDYTLSFDVPYATGITGDHIYCIDGAPVTGKVFDLQKNATYTFTGIPADHPMQIVNSTGATQTGTAAAPSVTFSPTTEGIYSLKCGNHGFMGGEGVLAVNTDLGDVRWNRFANPNPRVEIKTVTGWVSVTDWIANVLENEAPDLTQGDIDEMLDYVLGNGNAFQYVFEDIDFSYSDPSYDPSTANANDPIPIAGISMTKLRELLLRYQGGMGTSQYESDSVFAKVDYGVEQDVGIRSLFKNIVPIEESPAHDHMALVPVTALPVLPTDLTLSVVDNVVTIAQDGVTVSNVENENAQPGIPKDVAYSFSGKTDNAFFVVKSSEYSTLSAELTTTATTLQTETPIDASLVYIGGSPYAVVNGHVMGLTETIAKGAVVRTAEAEQFSSATDSNWTPATLGAHKIVVATTIDENPTYTSADFLVNVANSRYIYDQDSASRFCHVVDGSLLAEGTLAEAQDIPAKTQVTDTGRTSSCIYGNNHTFNARDRRSPPRTSSRLPTPTRDSNSITGAIQSYDKTITMFP